MDSYSAPSTCRPTPPPTASPPATPSPPPGIWFSEDTTATGTFSDNNGPTQVGQTVNDGFNDPASPSGSNIGTAAKAHYVKSSGGTVTTTLTASVSAKGTAGASGTGGAIASIGSITIAIHAQPYNFRRTYFANVTPQTSVIRTAGKLQFQYKWSSTDGVMGDLSGEKIHENVDAPSSPSVTIKGVAYYAPPAPFGWAPDFHKDSVSVDASSVDGMYDSHSWGNGQAAITDCFVQQYVANSFNLTQNYKFFDPATMQVGTEQQVPGNSGPFTIIDAVVVDSASPTGYSFTVTKDSVTSLPQPLP